MIEATRIAVGTTATKICQVSLAFSGEQATRKFLVKNRTATASVHVDGDAEVSADGPFEWAVADGPLEIELEPGEVFYGIVAATPQDVDVLAQGR